MRYDGSYSGTPTKDPTIKKKMGILALAFPLLYAFIDGTGAFLDGVYLEKKQILSEADALLSYEFSYYPRVISSSSCILS